MMHRVCMQNTLSAATAGLILAALACGVSAGTGEAWRSETIKDALAAAPPRVTDTASIYGWTSEGELVLARYGSGSYVCLASGSFSLRLGKPALPYADPMCLDPNAWAFIQALWSTPDPANPERPYPTEPGLIWMLAGMNVSKDTADIGSDKILVAGQSMGDGGTAMVQMTPHVMVLPLPFDESSAAMATAYALDAPHQAWIMAAGKPHEHLMMHFSAEDVSAMMSSGTQ